VLAVAVTLCLGLIGVVAVVTRRTTPSTPTAASPPRGPGYYVLAHQFSGPYEASTVVTWCSCEPVPMGVVQNGLDAIASHLGALPGGVEPTPVASIPTTSVPLAALPHITGITEDPDPTYHNVRVLLVDWGAYTHAKQWIIESNVGSFSGPGDPPPTAPDYSSPANFGSYRAIVCPNDCDSTSPPDASVGPGVNGPFVIGPWYAPTG
jgi:hypothetical protein